MRFWQFQQDARSDTRRLLAWFGVAVLASIAAVHIGLALPWWILSFFWAIDLPYPMGFLATNIGVSILMVLGGWWIETSNLRAGGVYLAKRIGAREIRPSTSHAEHRLSNIVSEMCIAAHMPEPRVMVMPRTEAINAFAAGWGADDAVLVVTQGALDYLTRDEMQGLVAHELSHIHEGDTRLKMQLAGMVFGLQMVHTFGVWLRDLRENSPVPHFGALGFVVGSIVMVVGFSGWMAGRLLKAAVSRQREHLADARAVQWTRSKTGLGGVLRKVAGQRRAIPQAHAAYSHRGLAHPLVQHMLLVDVDAFQTLKTWLQTHPSIEERIRRVYGCSMPPIEPVVLPDVADPAQPITPSAGEKTSIAALVDPFVRYL